MSSHIEAGGGQAGAAGPLGKVDKFTVVSSGNGDSAGLNKLTGDMTKIAAQVPALFEALSGMQISELLAKVRKIGEKDSISAVTSAESAVLRPKKGN